MTDRITITPPQLAKRWGVHPDKVLQLIKRGELKAMNLAIDPNGKPRFKIYLSDVEGFEATRMVNPPIEKKRRRRKRATATSGKDYF